MADTRTLAGAAVALAALVVLALVPTFASQYLLSLFITIFAYVALSTSWALFSGATRYVSLATGAFVGVGIYTVAVLNEAYPIWMAVAIAPVIAFVVALVVGLSTLRLQGVYFVIFTFGLTELIKQVVTWYEVNQSKTLTRFILADATNTDLYLMLLALAAFVIGASWWIGRTRYGYALRAIGEDETVARHTGIDVTRIKVLVFAGTAAVMSLTGAILSLRYTSVDPNTAFNSLWSFQVLIMALLGGVNRAWGPLVGVVPLVLLSEFLSGTFPHHFGIALGLCFAVIVFYLPGGVAGLIERWRGAR